MSSGYTTLKEKNGDVVLFGGSEKEKPKTIEIQKEDLLWFVEGFVEYLDFDQIESLIVICEDRLFELENKTEDEE